MLSPRYSFFQRTITAHNSAFEGRKELVKFSGRNYPASSFFGSFSNVMHNSTWNKASSISILFLLTIIVFVFFCNLNKCE